MKWISVKDKPIPYNTVIVAVVKMSDGSFEHHVIYVDSENGEILDGEGEAHDCWSVEDYSYWMTLPSPPEAPNA